MSSIHQQHRLRKILSVCTHHLISDQRSTLHISPAGGKYLVVYGMSVIPVNTYSIRLYNSKLIYYWLVKRRKLLWGVYIVIYTHNNNDCTFEALTNCFYRFAPAGHTFELIRCVAVIHFRLRVLGDYFLHLLQQQLELLDSNRGLNTGLPHLWNHLFKELAAVGPLHRQQKKERNDILKGRDEGLWSIHRKVCASHLHEEDNHDCGDLSQLPTAHLMTHNTF